MRQVTCLKSHRYMASECRLANTRHAHFPLPPAPQGPGSLERPKPAGCLPTLALRSKCNSENVSASRSVRSCCCVSNRISLVNTSANYQLVPFGGNNSNDNTSNHLLKASHVPGMMPLLHKVSSNLLNLAVYTHLTDKATEVK